ncbi:MAG: exodeoxyribonuclease VII large subunit [Firmicutes bacterium]|nr:exodeoxyribonuclease VII large subunit [Bacillota bacterium]
MGKGELHEQFEALKEKLKAEGLFDNKFKKPIPRFAKNVGVVTSVQGAVIKDIISTVRARNNIQDITVIDAKVQGQSAVESIANALLSMDSMGQDIIILARGGGSFEELMPFNNETLARVIFSLDTPIISAVGHETDFTIADFVADMRAITPTAGAEFVAFSEKEIINGAMLNLNRCKNILTHKVQSLSERVKYNLEKGYSLIDQKAHALISKLSALNPASLLEKGYFKITKNNESISGIDKLKEKDNIKIYDANGTAIAEIKEISYAENRK